MQSKFISTFAVQDLTNYFRSNVKRPNRFFRRLGDFNPEAEAQGFTVRLGKVFGSFWKERKLRNAAWEWLRPHDPVWGLDKLDRLCKHVGLDGEDAQNFAADLLAECHEFLRDHAPLSLWVMRRAALLEYQIRKPGGSPNTELLDAANGLRWDILRVASGLSSPATLTDVKKRATEISEEALRAAATTVRKILGGDGNCRLSANLMVPCNDAPFKTFFSPSDTTAKKNFSNAEALWKGLPSEKRLIVAAETTSAQHRGFWIPLCRSQTGMSLPGAACAYREMEGRAVFVDDLPPMDGFGDAIQHRWHAYMKETFQERLFVSLPHNVPATKNERICVAVLNINADPPSDDHSWRRAYHSEWLRAAAAHAAPFMSSAFEALQIAWAAEQRLILDTGYQEWDSFPIRATPPAIGPTSS